MKLNNVVFSGVVASAALLSACGGNTLDLPVPQILATFANGADGWKGAYADFDVATEPTDVVWQARALPGPLSGNAYYTGGTNRSDDLFIYSKKKFSGYTPSTQYKMRFEDGRHRADGRHGEDGRHCEYGRHREDGGHGEYEQH